LDKHNTIYVAGADTLIGSAITNELRAQGYERVLNDDGLDLTNREAVDAFFYRNPPDHVFVAAGKSGGIQANLKHPATLMLDNLLVTAILLDAAHRHRVKKLLYLSSACVYPKLAPQPMSVDSLLEGHFEPTNEAYATAKLAGIKLCQAYRQEYGCRFIAAIPANIFGPGDHFDPNDSHVIGALMYRMTEAKTRDAPFLEIWGSGTPRREFLFAQDLASACLFVMQKYNESQPINLGGGTDISIKELAYEIKKIIGYEGDLRFDLSQPDGMPRKTLDSSVLQKLGWKPTTPFHDALAQTYHAFLSTRDLTPC
jgi:GDP-L-fucose synthase